MVGHVKVLMVVGQAVLVGHVKVLMVVGQAVLTVGQAVLTVGHVKVLMVVGEQLIAVGMGQLVVGQTGGGTKGQEGSFVLLMKSGWTSTRLEPLNLQ